MRGRFSTNVVRFADTQPDIDYELVYAKKSGLKFVADQLIYNKGDYIRACRWDSSRHYGHGLNQRTLKWGSFPMYHMNKITW